MASKQKELIFLAPLLGLSLYFFLVKGFLPGLSSRPFSDKNFNLLSNVIRLIKNDYIEEKNPVETMDGAFKGMVNSLDALSSYLNKESTSRYLEVRDIPPKDIGVVLFKRYGLFPQVVGIWESSPAERRELKLGDYITEVDSHPTATMSLLEANLYLKSKDDNPLKLKILRDDKTLEIAVERASLFPEPVSYSDQKGTAGILQVHALRPPCVSKLRKNILPQLKNAKSPLIVDMRNCAEGTTEEAQKFVSLFLKAEQTGYFERKDQTKEYLSLSGEAELENIPLIIWVNQATMGPAELVAGICQEFKRAKIVGYPTPGLVAEQEFFPLSDGTSLLLTSGVFFLKNGEKLWGQGLVPDEKLGPKEQNSAAYLAKSLKPAPAP